ncbi:MAG: DoxX family protein [Patescibacteria group bacterium]
MDKFSRISLFLLRVSIGWMMFYSGFTKILNPEWSAAGYLQGVKTFASFYQWLLQPDILPIVNFLNEWGLTILGLSLMFGIFVRLISLFGAALMILYYFSVLSFPFIPPHSLIVDEHIIYALVLVFLAAVKAGRVWGLEKWCGNLPLCSKYPKIRNLLG